VAELGPASGERRRAAVLWDSRALVTALTPMPRTPMLGLAPGTVTGSDENLEVCVERSPCGCPPVEPGPN